ncbi:MAG TPA: excalibur calcium-binding domain-containing protein [Caulobacteraceae bacterium]
MAPPMPIPPPSGPEGPPPRKFGLREIAILAVLALTLAALWHEIRGETPAATEVQGKTRPFASCAEAEAAGAAPLSAGHPRFNPALDPDGDGWACDQPRPQGYST